MRHGAVGRSEEESRRVSGDSTALTLGLSTQTVYTVGVAAETVILSLSEDSFLLCFKG